MLGLIGESGAGKSTIGLSALAYGRGGCRIIGGEVILDGRDILKGGVKGVRGSAASGSPTSRNRRRPPSTRRTG